MKLTVESLVAVLLCGSACSSAASANQTSTSAFKKPLYDGRQVALVQRRQNAFLLKPIFQA